MSWAFWVGVDDGRWRQVSAKGRFDLGGWYNPLLGILIKGKVPVSIKLEFSYFGISVSIEAPQIPYAPPEPAAPPVAPPTPPVR